MTQLLKFECGCVGTRLDPEQFPTAAGERQEVLVLRRCDHDYGETPYCLLFRGGKDQPGGTTVLSPDQAAGLLKEIAGMIEKGSSFDKLKALLGIKL